MERTEYTPLLVSALIKQAQLQILVSVIITGIKIANEKDRSDQLYVSKDNNFFINPYTSDITLKLNEATVTYANYGNIYEKDQFNFNPRNGEITKTTLYEERTRYSQLHNWIYCIHTADGAE